MLDVKLRIPRDLKDRLAMRALENDRSINAETVRILKEALAPMPQLITIRECKAADGVSYVASVGDGFGDDFAESDTEDGIYAAVLRELKVRGLRLSDVSIVHRDEIVR